MGVDICYRRYCYINAITGIPLIKYKSTIRCIGYRIAINRYRATVKCNFVSE